MDLTIIVLNFNVRYLLESCLESVFAAVQSITAEVIVVDNASTDESVSMVKSKFPQVSILVNTRNIGFAKANNQAILLAKGRHVLILNPDTIVNAEAIHTCLDYLKRQDQVAAIGVKMLDGRGNFLKESKRGFPTLWSAWWKLTGINRWFPEHPKFNRYYLGQLDENGIHQVEVLTGAFMMVKKKILDQVGGFDEQFFMYGEDIDLSFRIRALGYHLVYAGTSSIIHLKGRSSATHSYPYVRNFYQAMLVFVQKYYPHAFAKGLMTLGIWIAGFLSWIKRKIFFHFLPLTDLVLISGILFFVQRYWAGYWFDDPDYFQHLTFLWNATGYVVIWFLSLFFFQAYHIQQSSSGTLPFKAIISGTGIILILYSLLPESWRTSRAIILISGILLALLLPLTRILLKPRDFGFRALLIGDQAAESRLNALFRVLCNKNYFSYISRIEPVAHTWVQNNKVNQLRDIILSQGITHIVIDQTNNWKTELLQITQAGPKQITTLVAESTKQDTLVHPNPIPGLLQVNIHLNNPIYSFSKIMLNTFLSVILLPWGWLIGDIKKNYLNLLTGKKQWVSYRPPVQSQLPPQKPGIWYPENKFVVGLDGQDDDVNFEYAKSYHPLQDIRIILSNLFKIVE